MKKTIYSLIVLVMMIGIFVPMHQLTLSAQTETDAMVALGRALFFDANLSVNGTQSCATCHAPEVGFTGPDPLVNAGGSVYLGALGMFPRPQVDNIVAFLKTLSDGYFQR